MIEKDFIDLKTLDSNDISLLLDIAEYLKTNRANGIPETSHEGKHLVMVFEKPSLRTRLSFEIGMSELGGKASYVSGAEVGLETREPAQDVARVISRYAQAIMIRTFDHENVIKLAKYADIPVINGLSDDSHPCQALADILTVKEHFGKTDGLKIVFVGDANNVSRSLARICILSGSKFVLACPKEYAFSDEDIKEFGDNWGTMVSQSHDPEEAVANADVLYSDVWTSMGQEAEKEQRLKDFEGYQINPTLVSKANKGVKIMHCLPAHRDEEITDETFEAENSIVFDQAENRMHAQKAIMHLLMTKDREQLIKTIKEGK